MLPCSFLKNEKWGFVNKYSNLYFTSQMSLLGIETSEKVVKQFMIIKCTIMLYLLAHFREDLSGSNDYESWTRK